MKASSSVISTSAWPSPSRSTNFRLGSSQGTLGSGGTGRKGCPAFVVGRARRSRAWDRPAPPGRAGRRRPGPGTARGRWLRWLPGDGLRGDGFERGPNRPPAQVALVEPGAGLLGQDAGDALAVQVDPLVGRAVEAGGQVLQACRVHLENLILDGCLAVLELERRQRLLEVGGVLDAVAHDHGLGVVPHVAGLRDRANERGEAGAALMGELVFDRDGLRVVEVGVVELGGAHQAVVALLARGQVGNVMEHQDAAAAAIGAHLEAGAVGGEGVGANGPGLVPADDEARTNSMLLGFGPGWVEIDLLVVALVVVEDHLEHPGIA